MFARLIDWAFGLVASAVAARIADQVSAATGETVEPLAMEPTLALPAPEKRRASRG